MKTNQGHKSVLFILVFMLGLTVFTVTSAQRSRGFDRIENKFDRREDIRDRNEDARDGIEDRRDRKENATDTRKDGGIRDRREDIRDRREDVRDRNEDIRDRREKTKKLFTVNEVSGMVQNTPAPATRATEQINNILRVLRSRLFS